ncbi:MAG: hypothetical protein U0638_12340 [Phycisphaerales bacterium]
MSARRRLERLERQIRTQWPRCATCGGYRDGGVVAVSAVWEPDPDRPPPPPDPRCPACGGPVEEDGRAPSDILPPDSPHTTIQIIWDKPGKRNADGGSRPDPRVPRGLPPA